MVELFRFDLVLLVFLRRLLTKFSCPVLRFGPKMLSITCKPFWMIFSQKILLILLLIVESDHHKCLILDLCSTKAIHYYLFLMVKSHPYILDGGILCGFCNGIMLKGCFFLLLSLIGFLINYRYLLCLSFAFDKFYVFMKIIILFIFFFADLSFRF